MDGLDSPPSEWQRLRATYRSKDESKRRFDKEGNDDLAIQARRLLSASLDRPRKKRADREIFGGSPSFSASTRHASSHSQGREKQQLHHDPSVHAILEKLRSKPLGFEESGNKQVDYDDEDEDDDDESSFRSHLRGSFLQSRQAEIKEVARSNEISQWVQRIKAQYETKIDDSENENSSQNARQEDSNFVRQWAKDEARVRKVKEQARSARKESIVPREDPIMTCKPIKIKQMPSSQPSTGLFSWETERFRDVQEPQVVSKSTKRATTKPKETKQKQRMLSQGQQLELFRLEAKHELRLLHRYFTAFCQIVKRQIALREERGRIVVANMRTRRRQKILEMVFRRLIAVWRRERQFRENGVKTRFFRLWVQNVYYLKVARRKVEREQREQEAEMQLQEKALQFYCRRTVRKHWRLWSKFVRLEKLGREAKRDEEKRKLHVLTFLEKLEKKDTPPSPPPLPPSFQSFELGDRSPPPPPPPPLVESGVSALRMENEGLSSEGTLQKQSARSTCTLSTVPSARTSLSSVSSSTGRLRMSGRRRKSSTQREPPPPPPQEVLNMEKRARERKAKREELRRQQFELEQMRLVEQQQREYEALAVKVEERRKKELERKERQKRILREKQITEEKQKLSELHRNRAILWYRGLKPWILLVRLRKLSMKKAEAFADKLVIRRAFNGLVRFMRAAKQVRRQKDTAMERAAMRFRRRSLLRLGWNIIKSRHCRLHVRQVALQAQRRHSVLRANVREWMLALRRNQDKFVAMVGELHHKKKRRIWKEWIRLVSETKLRTQAEAEKRQMWSKVRSWLDDF